VLSPFWSSTISLSGTSLALDRLVGDLETRNLHSAAQVVSNRLRLLRNIQAAQSLRPTYATIYNQCVVLLVSYFDATMGDLFRAAAASALRLGLDVPIAERTVQLSWRTLSRPEAPIEALIAERIVDEDDISFQDMQSIRRAFAKNLKIDLGRDDVANDVILGQAARHVMAPVGRTNRRTVSESSLRRPSSDVETLPTARGAHPVRTRRSAVVVACDAGLHRRLNPQDSSSDSALLLDARPSSPPSDRLSVHTTRSHDPSTLGSLDLRWTHRASAGADRGLNAN
jgi:hypothetical protein